MSRTISLPDPLYQRLASLATQQGKTADDVVHTLIEAYITATEPSTASPEDETVEGYDPTTDPLAPFIGAFNFGADRTWIDQHDALFGSRHASEA